MASDAGDAVKNALRKRLEKNAPGGDALKVSVFFFSDSGARDTVATYNLIRRAAALAEEEGLHALWVPERHLDPFGGPFPDPAILLAHIAAITKTLRLRAGSVVMPLHDPIEIAERWASLNELSDGRVGISLATGWNQRDFVTRPSSFENRRDLLFEGIEQVEMLWRGSAVERLGPRGEAFEVRSFPRPSSAIPVWLTSSKNKATWDEARRRGMNILTAVLEQDLETVLTEASEQRAKGFRGELTLMMHAGLDADVEKARRVARGPLRSYLRQHMKMFAAGGLPDGLRPDDLSAADREALIDRGVERYMNSSGLFGSAASLRTRMAEIVGAGVTEIACLVDFGGDAEDVLASVRELGRAARDAPLA